MRTRPPARRGRCGSGLSFDSCPTVRGRAEGVTPSRGRGRAPRPKRGCSRIIARPACPRLPPPGPSSVIEARARAAVGLVLLVLVAWLLSTDRRRISWRLVAWGIGLQVTFALLVLRTPVGVAAFDAINHVVHAVLGYGQQGSRFVFGNLVEQRAPRGRPRRRRRLQPASADHRGALRGRSSPSGSCPNIIFISSLMTVLYHRRCHAAHRARRRPGSCSEPCARRVPRPSAPRPTSSSA